MYMVLNELLKRQYNNPGSTAVVIRAFSPAVRNRVFNACTLGSISALASARKMRELVTYTVPIISSVFLIVYHSHVAPELGD